MDVLPSAARPLGQTLTWIFHFFYTFIYLFFQSSSVLRVHEVQGLCGDGLGPVQGGEIVLGAQIS